MQVGSVGGADPLPPEPEELDLDSALEDAGEELTFARGVTYVPEPIEAPEAAQPGSAATLDASGVSVERNSTRRPSGPSVGAGASVADGGGSATLRRDGEGVGEGISASVYSGWLSVALARERERRDGGVSANELTVAGWSDTAYFGASHTITDPDGAVRAAGASIMISADRRLTDLGEYTGARPELEGTRVVELQRDLAGSPAAVLGRLAGELGFSGRLAAGRARSVTYRTHLEPERARRLLHDQEGVERFVADKLRALGAAQEPLEVPDLSRPETLKVGDRLTVRTAGSVTAGLVFGALGAGVGGHMTLRGELEIEAHRLDANHVALRVSPIDVRGVNLSAQAPALVAADLERADVRALSQSFVFDLSQPEARAAYERALGGELPGSLVLPEAGEHEREALASRLERSVRAESLPPGVKRVGLEHDRARIERAGVGTRWGLLHELWGIANLGLERSRGEVERIRTDGVHTARSLERTLERRRHVLLSGTESLGVSARMRTRFEIGAQERAGERFVGLELEARFSDERVRGFELNDEVIDRINERFGTHIEPFVVEGGRREKRSVTLVRNLEADDLERLAHADPTRIAQAAERSGIAPEALSALVSELEAAASDGSNRDPKRFALRRAEIVQRFVADEGLDAMAALHALLGGDTEALRVETTSSLYDRPLELAKMLSLKYSEPVAADADNDALAARWKDVEAALELTDEAELAAALDPLLPELQRKALLADLTRARERLSGLLALDHLRPAERERLIEQLDAGWTTAREYRIMEALAAAGSGMDETR